MSPRSRAERVAAAARLAIGVGVVVLALKLGAWALTGSVALLSDALETVVNVLAAVMMWQATRVASRPPDDDHPFGHAKIEYFVAGAEGLMVAVAAVTIGIEGTRRLVDPVPASALGAGLTISLVAAAINGLVARHLNAVGRQTRSVALTADAAHLWADVLTTAGVFTGLVLAWITGFWWLDPVVALIVAVHVIIVGYGIVRGAVGGLMDEALPSDQLAVVEETLARVLDGTLALEAHDLRTRRAGAMAFVELHLVVPAATTVRAAHDLCDMVEAAVEDVVPGARVTVHIEPDSEAHRGQHDQAAPPAP